MSIRKRQYCLILFLNSFKTPENTPLPVDCYKEINSQSLTDWGWSCSKHQTLELTGDGFLQFNQVCVKVVAVVME